MTFSKSGERDLTNALVSYTISQDEKKLDFNHRDESVFVNRTS
jgi:hypothetical protein